MIKKNIEIIIKKINKPYKKKQKIIETKSPDFNQNSSI